MKRSHTPETRNPARTKFRFTQDEVADALAFYAADKGEVVPDGVRDVWLPHPGDGSNDSSVTLAVEHADPAAAQAKEEAGCEPKTALEQIHAMLKPMANLPEVQAVTPLVPRMAKALALAVGLLNTGGVVKDDRYVVQIRRMLDGTEDMDWAVAAG